MTAVSPQAKANKAVYMHSFNATPRIRQQRKDYRTRGREWLVEYKAARSCELCGESTPECLDFHHRDPTLKEASISSVIGRWSLQRLQSEVAKCVLVCANCHRKIHSGRISLGGI
jgi:hypothetical protein